VKGKKDSYHFQIIFSEKKTQRSLFCACRQGAGYSGQQAVPATVVQTGRIALLCSTRREHKSNCAALHPTKNHTSPKQGTNLTGRNCC
jgi:hypothetical protein